MENLCEQGCTIDTVSLLAQWGRFDLVSLLLTIVSLVLVLGGLFAFFNFRSIARAEAAREASQIAERIAERIANEYLQRELPDMLSAYAEFISTDDTSDSNADEIARAQDNTG